MLLIFHHPLAQLIEAKIHARLAGQRHRPSGGREWFRANLEEVIRASPELQEALAAQDERAIADLRRERAAAWVKFESDVRATFLGKANYQANREVLSQISPIENKTWFIEEMVGGDFSRSGNIRLIKREIHFSEPLRKIDIEVNIFTLSEDQYSNYREMIDEVHGKRSDNLQSRIRSGFPSLQSIAIVSKQSLWSSADVRSTVREDLTRVRAILASEIERSTIATMLRFNFLLWLKNGNRPVTSYAHQD